MKKNLLVSILVYVALLVCAVTMVPFKMAGVATIESVLKFIAFPILVIGASLAALLVRKNANDEKGLNKLCVYAANLPALFALSAGFVFMMTMALRNHDMGSELSLNDKAYVGFLICFIVAAIIFYAAALLLPKFELDKKTEETVPFSTIAIYAVLVVESMFGFLVCKEYATAEFDGGSIGFIVGIILAVLMAAGLVAMFVINSKKFEAVAEPEKEEEAYKAFTDEQLQAMNDYSKAELQNRNLIPAEETQEEAAEEEAQEEAKPEPEIKEVEKIVEVEKVVEKIVEVPVEKVVEKIVEVPVEKIVYVEKEPEVVPVPVKEPKEKVVKEKKEITPSVADIAKYITANFDDVEIRYGKDEENFKVFRNRKPMCFVQRTTNDYRITFQRKPISATKYMVKYPNAVVKATSPEGEQWFKMTNKGEIEEADIMAVVAFSHKYMEDADAKALEKKLKAKERAKAKKAKERAKARELAAKQKAKEKAAAEKAAKEAAAKEAASAKEEAPAEA